MALLLLTGGLARGERVLSLTNYTAPGAVVLPSVNALKFSTNVDFSVEFWIKLEATNEQRLNIIGNIPFAGTVPTTGPGWCLFSFAGSVGFWSAAQGIYRPVTFGVPEASAVTGAWHHVALSVVRTNDGRLYVDGALASTAKLGYTGPYTDGNYSYDLNSWDSTNAIRIGSAPEGGQAPQGRYPFVGKLDEVRIWNRARTAEEIGRAFRSRGILTSNSPGLVAYYNFNEASGDALCQGTLGAAGTATVNSNAFRVEDASLVLGAVLPDTPDYALAFDGTNQTLQTAITGDKLAGNELTVEYWFKGSNIATAVSISSASGFLGSGYNGGTAQKQHALRVGNAGANQVVLINPAAENGQWHHVALTWKRNTANGMVSYLDGVAYNSATTLDQAFPVIATNVWVGSFAGNSPFLRGALDEVRIWNRALSAADIADFAQNPRRLSGTEAGLVAYYAFNDLGATGPLDAIGKQPALFRNMTVTNYVEQVGVAFGVPVPFVSANPALAGLWLGEVSLQRVGDPTSASAPPTPAGGTFDFNIILHADSNGVVRLLKDVTIMQKRNTTSNLTDLVLLTDDTLIPNYDGIVKRSGKLVGVRYSSAFYQFDGQWLLLRGGLGLGNGLSGSNAIPATLPTNPFFHKYHPNHKNPVDLKGDPYNLARQIQVTFSDAKLGANDGRDKLSGTYRETITGLHKTPLITDGTISLQRVSLVNKLNNQ